MLNKPFDFDIVSGYGEFRSITAGGHLMKIMSVEVVQSRENKEMLKISLDTATDDSQPNYFADKYRRDTRTDKKWGCVMYQRTTDDQGATNRGFKTFITSVLESNPGFSIAWGAGFEACLKGKRVGAIFREEEYEKDDGTIGRSIKPFAFRSVDTIKEGVDIPEPKLLSKPATPASSYGNGGYRPTAQPNPSVADVIGGNPFFAPSEPPVQPQQFAFEDPSYGDTLPF